MNSSDGKCPCGSGFLASDCCIPNEAPVSIRGSGFNTINIDAKIVDNLGQEFIFGNSFSSQITLRNPHQINQIIELQMQTVGQNIVHTHTINQSQKILALVEELNYSLHSAKYRQKQFMFRYQLIFGEHAFSIKVKSNIEVEIEDIPLQVEFEDYISKVRTALDVLAKLISFELLGKFKTNGKLCYFLRNYRGNDERMQQLRDLYNKLEPWMNEIKNLRDAIQHEGMTKEFRSVRHDKNLLKTPEIKNIDLWRYGISLWKNLFYLVSETTNILFIN